MKNKIKLIILLLLGIYNGQFISNRIAAWHATGFMIRLLIVGVLLYPDVGYMLIGFTLAYPIYNIICALYLQQDWWYLGSTAKMDKYIPKWLNYTMQAGVFYVTFAYWLGWWWGGIALIGFVSLAFAIHIGGQISLLCIEESTTYKKFRNFTTPLLTKIFKR